MAGITWFKVLTDIFADDKIKILQSMPEGDSLLVMWFKVLSQAGKTNDGGYIYLKKNIPYTSAMLATLFGKQQQLVELAMRTFTEFGMIDIDDNGYVFVTNWEKHQNVEGMEKIKEQTRVRVQRHREAKRIELMGGDPCQYCGNVATGVDHIIATARGGKDVEENKVPCCIVCNRKKNDKPLVDFLNWERHQGNIRDDLVTSNAKLSKFVTLCNVTDRYIVTQRNATDIDIELDKEKDIKHIVVSNESDIAFNTFWDAYPSKGSNKKLSLAKWKLLWRDKRINMDEMLKGVTDYVNYQNHHGYKTCAAQVFLNQERWKVEWTVNPSIHQPVRNYSYSAKDREAELLQKAIQNSKSGQVSMIDFGPRID